MEIDPADYGDCFDIDYTLVKSYLDREVNRLSEELNKAENDAH